MAKRKYKKCLSNPEKSSLQSFRLGCRCDACVETDTQRREDPSIKYGDKDYLHDKHLRRTYGITKDEYELLLVEGDGGCWICGFTPESDNTQKNLHVDHCHETGAVRGLLCSYCNRALGLLKEDPMIIERLASYVHTRDPKRWEYTSNEKPIRGKK